MARLLLKIGIVGYFGLLLLAAVGLGAPWTLDRQPPEQPIAFPHTVHAGTLQLSCDFCHRYAERGRRAGVPALELCMSCHQSIATEREEIKKLRRIVDSGQPLHWVRVYQLPDFIYFSHKRHLKKGVSCAACHGEVARMKTVRRVRSLEMGWCLACHRELDAPTDCTTCHT